MVIDIIMLHMYFHVYNFPLIAILMQGTDKYEVFTYNFSILLILHLPEVRNSIFY